MIWRVLACLALLLPSYAKSGPTIERGDFNFDGHEDYRQQAQTPGDRCGWWDYFLFDPGTESHRPVETFFCNESFDAEREIIVSRASSGMAGQIYEVRHFRWEGFEPLPIYIESRTYDLSRNLFMLVRDLGGVHGPRVTMDVQEPQSVEGDLPPCWIPPAYKSVYVGLVAPTWESKAQMIEQIKDASDETRICWYGKRDGAVEARIGDSESHYRAFVFKYIVDSWRLIDAYEEITVE